MGIKRIILVGWGIILTGCDMPKQLMIEKNVISKTYITECGNIEIDVSFLDHNELTITHQFIGENYIFNLDSFVNNTVFSLKIPYTVYFVNNRGKKVEGNDTRIDSENNYIAAKLIFEKKIVSYDYQVRINPSKYIFCHGKLIEADALIFKKE